MLRTIPDTRRKRLLFVPPLIRNAGLQWIQHGDNVITLASAQSNISYAGEVTIKLASMGGVTTRGPWHNTNPMEISTFNETTTRFKVRLHGGFGFASSCFTGSNITQRFDDIANTWTARAGLNPQRGNGASYSLNGYGFVQTGASSTANERFDDVANTQTLRAAATGRDNCNGYSINGYGFATCGQIPGDTGLTERFDDVANNYTVRASATARAFPAAFGLNNYGFTACGSAGGILGTTERFDDVANTQTGRADGTPRWAVSGYALNGYGFSSGGLTYFPSYQATTERLDDILNTWTLRTGLLLARYSIAEFSLNGFGFAACGYSGGGVGNTERFDDIANTQTARTAATAQQGPKGYSTNEYFVQYMTLNA